MKSLLICFISLIVNVLSAQSIVFESDTSSWQTILNKAKIEKKLVFVDAVIASCAPCKRMAKKVFTDKKVGDFYNQHFINVKLDMDKGENSLMAKKYAIESYPTYLFINADDDLVYRGGGFTEIDTFLKMGDAATDPKMQFNTLKKQYLKGNNSIDFLKKFSYVCLKNQDDALTSEASKAYLNTQKDWLSKENMLYIKDFSTWIDNPAYGFILKNKDAFYAEFGCKFIAGLEDFRPASNVYRRFFDENKKEFDSLKVKAFLNAYLPKELADKTISRLAIWQFEEKNDTVNTLKSAISFFEKYTTADPRVLGRLSETVYEQSNDKVQLEKTLKWVLKAIEIEEDFGNDNAAHLYFKLKNKIKAKEYATKALNKAKQLQEDCSKIEELLAEIEKM
jgi:thioredoxin-related protein